MTTLTFQVNNIHCKQCERLIKTILEHYFNFPVGNIAGSVGPIEIDRDIGKLSCRENTNRQSRLSSLDDESFLTIELSSLKVPTMSKKIEAISCDVESDSGTVSVKYSDSDSVKNPELLRNIRNTLEREGFEVMDSFYVTDLESANHIEDKSNQPGNSGVLGWFQGKFTGRQVRRQRYHSHLAHCEYCRQHKSLSNPSESLHAEGTNQKDDKLYQATVAVSGMTCTSCCQRVEQTIKKHIYEGESVHIDMLNGIAKIIISNRQSLQKIIMSIRGEGYGAELLAVVPIVSESKYKVTAAIGGITCAACASTINHVVKELPFVDDAAINVVSKVGVFILDSAKPEQLQNLKESIEDAGYDFDVIGDAEKINHASAKKAKRTVTLRIDGMYCKFCPERISKALQEFGTSELIINSDISLKNPFIKFSYVPNVKEGITIRNLIAKILKEVGNNSDNNFKITIVEQLSLEDHLKRAAKKSVHEILIRLGITTIFAIPTFIFGVVGMSLLKSENKFRVWLMEPCWGRPVPRVVWILLILSTPVYFFLADIFHRKALKEVRALWIQKNNWRRRLFKFGSMNLLMSLGTSVAYFASIALLTIGANQPYESHRSMSTYFDSVVFLTFFLLIGRLLESISKSKTAAAISNLGKMKQKTARLLDGEGTQLSERVIDIKYLECGDSIKISPGESPPGDCIIIAGDTLFDESALTGESIPVPHGKGEQIFAGTVNVGRSTIIAEIDSVEGGSLLDQIINTVRDGQLKRAPVERLADALTGYFVPVIVVLAILTWLIWLCLGYAKKLPPDYMDENMGGWAVWSLEFAISVFVVACPCGIGLAAPTAIFVGAGLAAKYGILAKGGGAAFQDGSRVSVVCFDKTGTLTKGGAPKITHFAVHENSKVKIIAAQLTRDLESNSKHPLAIGVKNFINNNFRDRLTTTKIPVTEEVPGLGMLGDIVVNGESDNDIWTDLQPTKVILGNERFMVQNRVNMTTSQLKLLDEWKTRGNSVVIVALQCERFFRSSQFFPVLLMGARDEIREEAKGVVDGLQKEGIECWMISGDNNKTANAIAHELGIDQVVAEVLPNEKAEKVEWIQKTYKNNGRPAVVAMVGDGINDAPAMSKADIGIALASGSDLAMISCDFVLLSSTHTLNSLFVLFQLSKKVFTRVKLNFAWALIYNMIAVPIAAGVIYPYKQSRLSPVWASASMALSSVSVVLSSLALRLFRPSIVTLSNGSSISQSTIEHSWPS